MKRIALLLLAVVILAGIIAFTAPASLREAGNLNSIGASLGNDVAIKAYREGTLPYPEGAIIAALH